MQSSSLIKYSSWWGCLQRSREGRGDSCCLCSWGCCPCSWGLEPSVSRVKRSQAPSMSPIKPSLCEGPVVSLTPLQIWDTSQHSAIGSFSHIHCFSMFRLWSCLQKVGRRFGAFASASSSAARTYWDFWVLTSPLPSCWGSCVPCAWKYSVKRLTAIP